MDMKRKFRIKTKKVFTLYPSHFADFLFHNTKKHLYLNLNFFHQLEFIFDVEKTFFAQAILCYCLKI